MKNVKIQVVAAFLSLAAALPVKSRAGQWAPSNIPATFANLKTVAAKAAASAPAKAVLVSQTGSSQNSYDQLDALFRSSKATPPSFEDFKGEHKGQCYGNDETGPYKVLIRKVVADAPSATPKIDYIYPAMAQAYEMSLVKRNHHPMINMGGDFWMPLNDKRDPHKNYIEAATEVDKWGGSPVYFALDFVKVGNSLIAKANVVYYPTDEYHHVNQEGGFVCAFPLSNANQ